MPHPVSDRIMTMRIPLTKDRNAYAPTMTNPEENNETFYSQLKGTLRNIPSTDKLLLIGDFNARIGRENDKWPSTLGKYGIEKYNSNGELLLALCTEFDLIVTNTMFKQKDAHKTTWTHPRSRHGHMIDFIITRCRDKMDICSTRTMRGANCGTDHQMLRSRSIFSIRKKESLHTGMMVNVRNGGEVSDTFSLTNGVKQGCVLAPTLFSIFLSAMLEEAFRDMGDEIYIQSCQNADLFTVAHFRAKTKNTNILVRELLFADDSALIAHSAEEIQRIFDAFANASSKFGLKINIKKTEVMFQTNSTMTMEENINVDETTLNHVK